MDFIKWATANSAAIQAIASGAMAITSIIMLVQLILTGKQIKLVEKSTSKTDDWNRLNNTIAHYPHSLITDSEMKLNNELQKFGYVFGNLPPTTQWPQALIDSLNNTNFNDNLYNSINIFISTFASMCLLIEQNIIDEKLLQTMYGRYVIRVYALFNKLIKSSNKAYVPLKHYAEKWESEWRLEHPEVPKEE